MSQVKKSEIYNPAGYSLINLIFNSICLTQCKINVDLVCIVEINA